MKTNSEHSYPSQSILLLRRVKSNTIFQCDNKRQLKKKFVSFIFNCSITRLITLMILVDESQAKYYTQNRSDQIPVLFYTVLQYKNGFIKLSSTQNFPAGAGTRSALLGDFPTPRCCHLQPRDSTDFVRSVLENRGAEQGQGYVMYCRLSRAHSLAAQQSTGQLLLFCVQASEQILQSTQQNQAKDRVLLQDSHLLHCKVIPLLSSPFEIE